MNQLLFTPEQRVLVKVAHPDDETLAAAAIQLANEQASTVHVMYDTNGEASTVGDPDLVENGYRAFEAIRALKLLGIPPQRIHFGRFPDGLLDDPDVLDDNAEWTTDLAQAYGLNTFITMGRRGVDKHKDHIFSHRAGLLSAILLGKLGTQADVLAINASHRGALGTPVNAALKRLMTDQHVTQNFRGRQDEVVQYGDLMTRQETYDHILRGSMVYTNTRIREIHEALQHTDPTTR